MKHIQRLLFEAGYNPEPYSGRGMFGKRCVSVQGDYTPFIIGVSLGNAMGLLGNDEPELWLTEPKTDSLGKGLVVYWPDEEWEAQP